MTVSGVFLGEMNANVGIKGGCQFLGNMSGQQVLESFCLSRKHKSLAVPCSRALKDMLAFL